MDNENTWGQDLKKKVLWGLGILIIIPVTISLVQYFSIENQLTDGWVFYTTKNSELNSDYAGEVEIDNHGKVWIGTNEGVNVISGDSWQNYPLPDYIRGMAVDPGGRIWVVLTEEIYIFESENLSSPSRILLDNDRFWDLPIAFDLSGKAWIGTNDGVKIFDGTKWTTFNVNNSGIISDDITAIAFNASGKAWIGTGEGISVLDGEDWISYNTTNSDIPGNDIQTIVFDHIGRTWIGTRTNGVGVFDGEDWESKNTEVFGTGYVHDVVGIAIDSDGHAIVLHNFLTNFNGTDWITYDVWNSGLANASGNDIAIDLEGRIWITSHYGVNVATLDYASPNAEESQNRYAAYENSYLDWKFLIFPVIGLSIIWAAIYLEDFVILVLGCGIFVFSLGILFNFLIIGEFDSILLFPVLFGSVLGGLVGSVKRNLLKQDGRFSVNLTITGTLIGAFIGFLAGIFLVMLATSY